MDKTAIKKYAIWAREELIKRVATKAEKYGITKSEIVDMDATAVNGYILSQSERNQRRTLIEEVEKKGYEQIMEEVAYTWFNRFSALRFMEVNNYLPTRVRVFTDENNNFNPQILAEALHLDLEGLNRRVVIELKELNKTEELYKYLIITQCNALSSILPQMFQKISDYTELLFPDNILRSGSVIEQMIAMIHEEDWKDAVQIIGWLYQHYNSVPKDIVFANLKKNIKIKKEDIPAATQLFTPDWIVRYMVENSLGRTYIEWLVSSGKWTERERVEEEKRLAEKFGWKYYLPEAEQTEETRLFITNNNPVTATFNVKELKCIDPCMGSGHILVYMFDVLMQIYLENGYSARDAVASIMQNNLFGLDIDERASQLAYFAVMMKARGYDSRFFSRKVQPNVFAIIGIRNVKREHVEAFSNKNSELADLITLVIRGLYDAPEFGSILNVDMVNFSLLYDRINEMKNTQQDILGTMSIKSLLPLIKLAEVMAQKYDVVVTNPPYMGASGMNGELTTYIKENYPNSKSDLFAVFIEKCLDFAKRNGIVAMITQHSWMFLSSYEKLRGSMLNNNIINMAHLGARAFEEIGGEVVQTTTFVIRKSNIEDFKANYKRLVDYNTQYAKEEAYLTNENLHISSQNNFSKIPGSPIAYWSSLTIYDAFDKGEILKNKGDTRQGMATSDNNRFLRLWHEIQTTQIGLGAQNAEQALKLCKKWYPYNKGGEFRKWYGNQYYVINYENDGAEVKQNAKNLYNSVTRTIKSISEYFKPCISWSKISSGNIAFRFFPAGFIFDVAGCSIFFKEDELLLKYIAFLNSKIATEILDAVSPTLNYEAGHIANLPILMKEGKDGTIIQLVEQNISISKTDWDSFETSWDFEKHPLV